MSKALRCDKCGRTFSPFLIGDNDLFTTISEVHFQNRKDAIKNTCADRKTDLNFCPDCTIEFKKFMEDFENETNYLYANAYFNDSTNTNDPKCIRGRYKYEGSSRNSNCEASEWTDDTQ